VKRCLWLMLLVLSGCATTPKPAASITGNTTATAASLTSWMASGRIGINSPAQSGSGSLEWRQQRADSQVTLRGPAGMGGLIVALHGTQLQVSASDGSTYDAQAARLALQQRLGVSLPLEALSSWLRGVPAAGDFQWLDAGLTLQQFGWLIHYADWAQQNSLRLPIRLTLSQDQVRVTLKIREWHVDE